MKKILVPTDFSECADNAVEFAVQSAKILPAEIILLHSYDLIGDIYIDYKGVQKEFNQSARDEMQVKLAQVKKSIEDAADVVVTTRTFKGTVKDAVVQTSIAANADLIVMGTLGASGLKEKLWGSKTASIIGRVGIPVMAIPNDYKWKKPEKFLLATKYFEREPVILDFIFELANFYKAQVAVAVFTDEDDDKAHAYLEHARKTPQYEHFLMNEYKAETLTVTHLFGLKFEETLQKYIKENGIDVLVMVTYQKEDGILNRVFNPSKTKRMSYQTTIPLLAIPGK